MKKSTNGYALLVCLLFIALAMATIAVVASQLNGRAKIIDRMMHYELALEGAESALTLAIAALEAGQEAGVPEDTWSPAGIPVPFPKMRAWATATELQGNTGEDTLVCVNAFGKAGDTVRVVECVLRIQETPENAGAEQVAEQVSWREIAPQGAGN